MGRFSAAVASGIVSGDLQEFLNREVSGREAILSGFFSSVRLFPHYRVTPGMHNRAEELLEFLEIGHLAEKNMTEMSTGEARRVLIARALVHRPKALILDEPSNGLDPHAARKFAGSLGKIARAGKSVILVTHHLPDIIPEISRVMMLRHGRLFADGPKRDVLTAEHLSELFAMPVEVMERDGYYHLMA